MKPSEIPAEDVCDACGWCRNVRWRQKTGLTMTIEECEKIRRI